MKYQVTVTNVGDFALQLLRTRASLILFNKDVPYHYKEMVISHTKAEIKDNICIDDIITLGDFEYTVKAIGENVMEDIRKNGHCTLVFDGIKEEIQPGQIIVEGPHMPRVMVGDMISVE